jgi:hypothetical protein
MYQFLCWYETWPFALMEGRKFQVLENKVLRKIFGLKQTEVREKCRILH